MKITKNGWIAIAIGLGTGIAGFVWYRSSKKKSEGEAEGEDVPATPVKPESVSSVKTAPTKIQGKLLKDAPIYSKPDNKSSVVRTEKSGTTVNINGATVYFYKVADGYILKDNVTKDLKAEVAPVTPEVKKATPSTSDSKKYMVAYTPSASNMYSISDPQMTMFAQAYKNGQSRVNEKFMVGNSGKPKNDNYYLYNNRIDGWVSKDKVKIAYEPLTLKASI